MKKLILLLMILSLFAIYGESHYTNTPIEAGEITEEETVIIEEPEVLQSTNLDVFLLDKINNNQIILKNCVLILQGEMRVCEDSFTYNNSFVDGDLYKITLVVELKEKEEE